MNLITAGQLDFLENLVEELGDTRRREVEIAFSAMGEDVQYLEAVTRENASQLIGELSAMRAGRL